MTESNLLLEAFIQRWGEYRAKLKLCQVEFTEAAVHDLRVATRRLLAVLEIIQNFDRHPRIKNLRQTLKSQLDGFDNLRDIQVMLLNISGMTTDLPDLTPFKLYLEKCEIKLLRAAKKQVLAIKSSAFQRRMLNTQHGIAALPVDKLPARLLQVADKTFETVQKRYILIDPVVPASIHAVRIAFKKFRYTVECVHPILPDFPESQFERMRTYQTLMGNIQDAEVFLRNLSKFMVRHPEYDLDTAKSLSEQGFNKTISVYLDHQAELQTFWRENPKAEFSWRTKSKAKEPV